MMKLRQNQKSREFKREKRKVGNKYKGIDNEAGQMGPDLKGKKNCIGKESRTNREIIFYCPGHDSLNYDWNYDL